MLRAPVALTSPVVQSLPARRSGDERREPGADTRERGRVDPRVRGRGTSRAHAADVRHAARRLRAEHRLGGPLHRARVRGRVPGRPDVGEPRVGVRGHRDPVHGGPVRAQGVPVRPPHGLLPLRGSGRRGLCPRRGHVPPGVRPVRRPQLLGLPPEPAHVGAVHRHVRGARVAPRPEPAHRGLQVARHAGADCPVRRRHLPALHPRHRAAVLGLRPRLHRAAVA